jgi:hypothetical protein
MVPPVIAMVRLDPVRGSTVISAPRVEWPTMRTEPSRGAVMPFRLTSPAVWGVPIRPLELIGTLYSTGLNESVKYAACLVTTTSLISVGAEASVRSATVEPDRAL